MRMPPESPAAKRTRIEIVERRELTKVWFFQKWREVYGGDPTDADKISFSTEYVRCRMHEYRGPR